MVIIMSRRNVDECFYEDPWEEDNSGLPNESNMNLPFLAYGFFKPHQLSYSQIKKFVHGKPKKVDVFYKLKNINGMPVLLKEPYTFPVQAYIIDFKNHMREDAYEHVGKTKNIHIYSWNVITVETKNGEKQDVNVLMYPENETLPKKLNSFPDDDYDWRRDELVFDATLDYLDWQISQLKQHPYELDWSDLKPLIGVQSLYMTLWSAIDRFIKFRYGKKQKWNVKELSLEESFKKSLQENYDAIGLKSFYKNRERKNDEDDYKIFSTQDLEKYCLDPLKPTCSAMYYYNLRNNVVHSSKVNPSETDIVWNALLGLKEIFREVLKEVREE